VIGFLAAACTCRAYGMPWWHLGIFFFVVTASHGFLDLFTDGGLGIAYFWPVTSTRFGPWGPIRVSMIGRGFFSARSWQTLKSEFLWVWLPAGMLFLGITAYRRLAAAPAPAPEHDPPSATSGVPEGP
jgi:inner membrane protein